MKTKVFLDEDDIQRIVATHYNVEPKDVDMRLFMSSVGYGMNEHNEPALEVIVTMGDYVAPMQRKQ